MENVDDPALRGRISTLSGLMRGVAPLEVGSAPMIAFRAAITDRSAEVHHADARQELDALLADLHIVEVSVDRSGARCGPQADVGGELLDDQGNDAVE